MKRHYYSVFSFLFIIVFFISGCKGKKTESKTESKPEEVVKVSNTVPGKPVAIGNETTLLLKDLKENGDYVNSKLYPSIIKASVVNESLGKNILIVDLRAHETVFRWAYKRGCK